VIGDCKRPGVRIPEGYLEDRLGPTPHLRIDEHHVLHWSHGGDTNLPNLVLLCYRHHWMVHEGGWQLVRTDHQQVLAISPFQPHRSWTRAPDGVLTT
jgi:hypothetical protein